MSNKQNINVEVVSDIMCPWCWVGKRKLEAAMKEVKDQYNFKVTWHPFLLRPGMPEDGVTKQGGGGGSSDRLVQVGKTVGIDFTYKCRRYPNTVVAHAALEYALEADLTGKIQNKLQEAIFQAYFTDGIYPDVDNVTRLAVGVGLHEKDVRSFITNEANKKHVRAKAAENSTSGVSGVPHFIINGHSMFSGAQDPDTFIHAFNTAAHKFPIKASI